ncbi:carbohydrate binding domain-containing protein [Fictibacillus nanhaiensis]|uniref:carbohydrate binding domain-containing protein n=1 Tax=Fictibacillus nanhaiensis TaxID=742169 RepID=UPI001C951229|nr:carbohydrate binding domain-containing protein [Fictibacillus nanhaiensis]MBY6038368.1 carbohydrate binding domain-containing protein [Fictibacillus nanhaiensis]
MKKTFAFALSALLLLPSGAMASPKEDDHAVKEKKNAKTKWTLTWSDEFNKPEIDSSKWTYDIGNWIKDEEGNYISPGWGNNEKQYYTSSENNSFVKDGKLIIRAQKERTTDDSGTYDYTSAKLKTKGLFSQTYGRYEVRAKLPTGKGLWPAIWMLPEQDKYGGWAASGEIDIMEAWGSKPNKVAGTIHYGESWPNNRYTGKDFELPAGSGIDTWHTYSIEWEPGEIRWYVDGELYQTQNEWYAKGQNNPIKFSYPAPFDQNFYLIMNLAVGGWFDGDPDETTRFPQQMEIDYVRVYDLKNKDYRDPIEPSPQPVELPANAKQPLADGNLIYDGNFEKQISLIDQSEKPLDALYWNLVTLPDFGGEASVEPDVINDKTFAKVTPQVPGSFSYSVQAIQLLSVGKNGRYKVSFDAKSTTDRQMSVKVGGGADRGWSKYSNEESIKLSDQLESYSFTFDMLADTDIAARLEFNLGNNGTSPVWLGNVRVEQVTNEPIDETASKNPLPDGNHVYNGTFDQGNMNRMTYWSFASSNKKDKATVNEETREFHANLKGHPAQEKDKYLVQKGVQLIKDNEYALSFKGRSDKDRNITIGLLSEDGRISYITPYTVELDKKDHTFETKFLFNGETSDYNSQLIFFLGGHSADVYLDDIVLKKLTNIPDYNNVDMIPLKNGDFRSGLSFWNSYIHYDAKAAIVSEYEQAQIRIESEGNETWSVLLEQGNLNLVEGLQYELRFTARSEIARDMEVTLENAQYNRYFNEKVAVGAEETNYAFTFSPSASDTMALKFLLGKSSGSPFGPHTIYLDNVELKVLK